MWVLGEKKSHRTVKTSSRALLLSNKRSILQLKTAGKPPAKLCWTASQFIAIVSFSCLYLQIFVNDQQLKAAKKRFGRPWGSESLWPKFWFCKLFLFKHGDYSGFPWNCSPDTSSYQYIKIDINCVNAQYLDRAEKHLHISWDFAGSCLKPWQQ